MINLTVFPIGSSRALAPAGPDRNLSELLVQLGVCRWAGRLQPARAGVIGVAPDSLAEFAPGGANWFDRVYPADRERVSLNLEGAARGETVPAFEYRIFNAAADIIWIRHWFLQRVAVRAAPRHAAIEGYVQVIDERKGLEAECLRICETERHQIGQELHDDVCQVLAGVACMLEHIGQEVKGPLPRLLPVVNELVCQVNGGMARARSLAHGLVPLHLTGTDLRSALEALAEQTATTRGIVVSARLSGKLCPHEPKQILHLYRIAQEAIGNAVKHGSATRIELSLRRYGRGARLTIADNGNGLPKVRSLVPGLGLHLMHHRALEIGAEFSITRRPTGGTLVRVDYPPLGPRPAATNAQP